MEKKTIIICPVYRAFKKKQAKFQSWTYDKMPKFKTVSLFISTDRDDAFKFNRSKTCYLKPSVKEEGESFAHFKFHKIRLPSSCFEKVKVWKRGFRFRLKPIFLEPLTACSLKRWTNPKIFFDGLLIRKEFLYPSLVPGNKPVFKVQDEAVFARYKGCHTNSNFDQFADCFNFEKNFSIFSSLLSTRIESLQKRKSKD